MHARKQKQTHRENKPVVISGRDKGGRARNRHGFKRCKVPGNKSISYKAILYSTGNITIILK